MLRVLLVVLLCAVSAEAQTLCDTNCTVPANHPVEVLADRADPGWSYVLTMNGASVVGAFARLEGSTLVYAFPSGLVAGSYTFRLVASSAGVQTAEWTNALTVTAPAPVPQPVPPSTPTDCTADGTTFPAGTEKRWTFTNKHGQVGSWIASQEAGGWSLVSWTQRKGVTTVVMSCG